ncbi:MAG TPA: helix-turn-helix domain-containing protein [Gammaproteobacteria bacterium]
MGKRKAESGKRGMCVAHTLLTNRQVRRRSHTDGQVWRRVDPKAPMVRSCDDLVTIPDDLARIVARPDDSWRGTVTHMPSPPDDTRQRSAARLEALEKALKTLMRSDGPETTRQRRAPLEQRRVAEHDLIEEITSAARRIAAAYDRNGEPVYRTDGIWRVLATVASSPYCLAIADLARSLGVRKQTAHELAHAAASARVIELVPNPEDKRILQALLTETGRAELAAARTAAAGWLAALLNGLGDHELKATIHVVRVIRQRLERDARERDRQSRGRARRAAERARRNAFLSE